MATTHKILPLILAIFISIPLFGQVEIDEDLFLNETQKDLSTDDDMVIVWWLPPEFWEMNLREERSISEEELNEFMSILRPYTMFAIVHGKIGYFGGLTFTSYDSLRKSIDLVDLNNTRHLPLDEKYIDPDVQNLINIFRPMLKSMIGQLGENMHFFVFKDLPDDNIRVADPYAKGVIKLNFSTYEVKWKTPLGSLLPKKMCPTDNELMIGSWDYCPWHGTKLIENK